ncbi:MAG: hypothetical protein ACKPGK_04070, partial [Verrucomicrobiota bacterium]
KARRRRAHRPDGPNLNWQTMISRAVAWILGCFLLAPAFGQGLIDLNNRGMAQVFDATGKPLTGTRFVAQIW